MQMANAILFDHGTPPLTDAALHRLWAPFAPSNGASARKDSKKARFTKEICAQQPTRLQFHHPAMAPGHSRNPAPYLQSTPALGGRFIGLLQHCRTRGRHDDRPSESSGKLDYHDAQPASAGVLFSAQATLPSGAISPALLPNPTNLTKISELISRPAPIGKESTSNC